MSVAVLGRGSTASVSVAGAVGPAREITTAGAPESGRRSTAVHPSRPMLGIAVRRRAAAGLAPRTVAYPGRAEDLPEGERHDAATPSGVLHPLPGDEPKRATSGRSPRASIRAPRWSWPATTAPTPYASSPRPPGGSGGCCEVCLRPKSKRSRARSRKAPIRPTPRRRYSRCSTRPASGNRPASSAACSGVFWGAWLARRAGAPA